MITIFKEKGNIQDCGNYRDIKMISHTIKIWERIIDRSRLREKTSIGEEQFTQHADPGGRGEGGVEEHYVMYSTG